MSDSAAGTLRLLITAGPTHEPIDAVRYLANRSSGQMGLALAAAAAERSHRVTLLLGPTPRQPSDTTGIDLRRFHTTADLQALLTKQWPSHDVLIMAAAVADFRPRRVEVAGKMPRATDGLTLHLEPTPDLLATLAEKSRPDQTIIGFALEPPERLAGSAREKLQRKGVDAIVANPLSTMESDHITAIVFLRHGGQLEAPTDLPKPAFADWLLDQLPHIRRR